MLFARGTEASATLAAFGRAQAIIEFSLDGRVRTANTNFLNMMGYTLAEIKGKDHRVFVDPVERESPAYKAFWDELRAGRFNRAQFKRFGKNGREVWIEASYNPVMDGRGRPFKVVKIATDITEQKRALADLQGQIRAINISQAVIEFGLDGTILFANETFLTAMGYSLEEIVGQHHSIFLEPDVADSEAYRTFWQKLNRGEFQGAIFKRLGKGGREVWIEASYNLIRDLDGKPWKVVKYATEITERVTTLAGLKSTMDSRFDEIKLALDTSNQEADRAAAVVEASTQGVQGMASNAEELALSVRQIAGTMAKSRAATEIAASQIGMADDATRRLAGTSTSMGGIVELIRGIAGQINLLALNATIESARAGEAGKGFAVVAGEVKNLAQQSRDATDRIAAEIKTLQGVSRDVVASLAAIGGAVSEVRAHVEGTANAMEAQSAVTQTMSSGMQAMAQNVLAINDNMTAIGAAVGQVYAAVDSTRQAARVLVQ